MDNNFLFQNNIYNWPSWAKVFQSKFAFHNLIKEIFYKEDLPFNQLENLISGTNAVFKVGNYIIKIFAPLESGKDFKNDFLQEITSLKSAISLNINTPKIISYGTINDRYLFRYIILEYISGIELSKIWSRLDSRERYEIGRLLKILVDKFNCESDILDHKICLDKLNFKTFNNFPKSFKLDREDYINSYPYKDQTYVHGDLNKDNILISNNKLYLLDFADSLYAPKVYEESLIIAELFEFDRSSILGYFNNFDIDKLTEICISGLLIHEFGGYVIKDRIANPKDIESISSLENLIRNKLT